MRSFHRPLNILVMLVAISSLAAGSALAQSYYRDKGSKSQQGATSQPAATTITINDQYRFVPAKVTVHVGDTVTWKNSAGSAHTVVDDPAKATNKADVSLPPGAEPFNSGKVQPGSTFSHTFTVPGTYKYVCVPHEGKGMHGTVEVLPAGTSGGASGEHAR